jgi:mono/diheme cytochrome c family protein
MNRRVASWLVAFALVFAAAANAAAQELTAADRGKYLVETIGCAHCHTPLKMGPKGPEPDPARMYSGHPSDVELPPPPALPPGPWNAVTGGMTAWAGPWGISYAANLTSDKETGLGAWDKEMFVAALKTGKHLGMGRDILPPMPHYPMVSVDDLEAMFAYFMTVPPTANVVPEPVPPVAAPGKQTL